ncbi:MAG: phosphatase PAP2 family protein [Rhizobiaceae bacterium]|nr:phosphatase PAP2 family protein [Rhizobiaceae bacterium]
MNTGVLVMLSSDRETIWPAVARLTATAVRTGARRAARDIVIPTVRAAVVELPGFAQRAPIRFLSYLLVGLSFLFMAFPGIDIAVSGLFAAPGGGFPLSDDPLLVAIRDFNRLVPKLLLPGLAAVLLLHAFRPAASWLLRPHQALYAVAVYAVGGGIVVHFLKNFVGRARPEDIVVFGGTELYTVAWQLSEACMRNCSFSSGEAASAIAMLTLAVIAPGPWRGGFLAVLVPVGLVFSLNRIAFGSHFLSDVVVSWLLVAIVAVALHRAIFARAEAIDRAVIGAGQPLANRVLYRLRGLAGTDRPGSTLPPQ